MSKEILYRFYQSFFAGHYYISKETKQNIF